MRNLCGHCRGQGCACCHGIGYLGRTVIHELLTVDAEVRELIVRRTADAGIEAAGAPQRHGDAWRMRRSQDRGLRDIGRGSGAGDRCVMTVSFRYAAFSR